MGCRYYLGNWDAEQEQFVPESHGRMNWRRPEQSIYTFYRDFFAPESVLTPDRRRVMWAWISISEEIKERSIQSLPRELSLAVDGSLRLRPLRELESLRYDRVTITDLTVTPPEAELGSTTIEHITKLKGDAFELGITIDRAQAERKRFGFQLFADDNHAGLPIMIHPETGTLRVGTTEAPFAVADLPESEDLMLHIFIDKYLVEVFVNDRQAVVASDMGYQDANGLKFYTYGAPTTIRQIDIWKMKATNQGFFKARENRIWTSKTEQI